MARFWPEPTHTHGSQPLVGVLLVNLGTPDAPTAAATRRYLKQFLSDPRVVEVPRLIWWPLLNGYILNTRSGQSAAKYASIWSEEGSPLRVHTERQAACVADSMRARGHGDVIVDWAMRYGRPSVPDGLAKLREAGCTRILVLPLYPQYAASTTASVMDQVARCMQRWRNQPEIRHVRNFADDAGYIDALAHSIREHWQQHGESEKLIMSFHGIPRRSLDQGDPYYCECQKTGRLVAEALGLPPERWQVTFQSRFGRAAWLQPYTEPTLEALAREGVRSVDILCPGFVSDCIETLEEIAMECKEAFQNAGGKSLHYIPCLNERPVWIGALTDLICRVTGDWLAQPPADEEECARALAHARSLGAER